MIFIVTNRKICGEKNFLSIIEACVNYKPTAIILREKDLDYDNFYNLAVNIKNITDKYNVPLIINGNFNIAKQLNCFAYHCGIQEFKQLNEKIYKKVGVSIHSVNEAMEAERLGADYILAGHIYETKCKEGLKGRGEDFVTSISKKISIPIIAIGGITEENTVNVMKSGANGIAIMSSAMINPSIILKLKEKLKNIN